MKRFISLVCVLLALAMVTMPLISCGDTSDETTTSKTTTPATSDERTIIPTATPEGTTFGGEKIATT